MVRKCHPDPVNQLPVKFEYSNGKTGCIDVGSVEQGKQWRTEEIGTICELSRVVAVFVTSRVRKCRKIKAGNP